MDVASGIGHHIFYATRCPGKKAVTPAKAGVQYLVTHDISGPGFHRAGVWIPAPVPDLIRDSPE
jgi:hypothetical protein